MEKIRLFLTELLLLSCQNILTLTIFEGESNKTSVLLCKRLPGQCRDVYMVVYFHLHWWWWAVVDCAVLYWAVLGCTGLNWAVLDCTGLY